MADRYWVGGSGTWNTTSTTNWSASSGGPSGASVPTAADNVFFDQAATYTVTMTGALACLNLTVSAGTVTFATGTTPTLAVSGNWSTIAGTVWNSTGTITFNATGSRTITSGGITINAPITFNGVGGTWTLQDNLTVESSRTITLTNGTLALGANTLTAAIFSSSNSNTRTINFGTGKIVLNGAVTATAWTTSTITNLTISGTPLVECRGGGAGVTKTITTGTLSEANSISFSFIETGGTAIYSLGTSVFRNILFNGVQTISNSAITVYGNFTHQTTNGTTTFTAGTSAWVFAATSGNLSINNIAGFTYDWPWTFGSAASTATWTFQNNFVLGSAASRVLSLVNGTVDFNNKTFTGLYTITVVTGTVTLNSTGATTFSITGAVTHTSGTLNLGLNLTSTAGYTLTAGTLNINNNILSVTTFASSNSNIRTLAFGSGQIILTGNNATIFNFATTANLTTTGTPYITSTYTGATGTRTFSTGFTEAQSAGYDVKTSGTSGIIIGTAATDIVALTGNFGTVDLTGLTNTISNTVRSIYGDFIVPASGGTLTAGANATTFASTNATARVITTAGRNIPFPIVFGGVGGTFQLNGNLTLTPASASNTITLTAGALDLNNNILSGYSLISSNSNVRSISFGTSGQITLTGNSATIINFTTATGFTYSGTPRIYSNYNGATGTRTINFGGTAGSTSSNVFDISIGTSGTGIFLAAGTDTLSITGGFGSVNFTGVTNTVSNTILNIYGNLTVPAAGGTFTAGTNTWTFVGITDVTQIVTTNGRVLDFPFTVQSSGTVRLSSAFAIGTTRTLTLTSGVLDLNGFTLTTALFSSSNSNTRTLAFGTGQLALTGSAATIFNLATATGFTTTGTPYVNSTYVGGGAGTRTFSTGFTEAQAAGYDVKTTGTSGIIIGIPGSADTVAFSGGFGSIDLTGLNVTVANSVTTVYGNFTVPATGGTLTAGTNAITFASTNASARTITTNGRNIPFPLVFNGAGGTFQLSGSLTLTPAVTTNTITLTAGTLDLNNFTATAYTLLSNNSNVRSIAFGSTGQITVTGNSATVLDFTTATNFTYTGTAKVYSNYTGATGTRTFNFGSSGGSTSSNVFDVIFATSGSGLIINPATDLIALVGYFGSLNLTGLTNTLSNSLTYLYGNLTVPSTGGTLTAGTNALSFVGSGTQTITTNGRTLDFPINFNGSGTTQLAGALTLGSTRVITLTSGILDLNGFTLTGVSISSNNSNVRSISFGTTSQITLTGNTTTLLDFTTATNFTYSGTPRIYGSGGSGTGGTRTFDMGSSGGATSSNVFDFTTGATSGTGIFVTGNDTVRLNGYYNNINISSNTHAWTNAATFVYGNMTFPTTNSIIGIGANALTFVGSVTQTLQTNGISLDFPITINGSGVVVISSNLNINARQLTLSNGVFDVNNKTVTSGTIAITTGSSTLRNTGGTQFTTSQIVNHISGSFTLETNLTATATTGGGYTFTAGTLSLGTYKLKTHSFNSPASNNRTINFGTGNIELVPNTTPTGNILLRIAFIESVTYTGTPYFIITPSSGTTVSIDFSPNFSSTPGLFSITNSGSSGIVLNGTPTGASYTLIGSYQNIDLTGFTSSWENSGNLYVAGNLTTPATGGSYADGLGVIWFVSTGSQTVNTNGRLINRSMRLAYGGTLTLASNLTLKTVFSNVLTYRFFLDNGTLDIGSYTLSTGSFSSTAAAARTINFGTGKIVLNASVAETIWTTTSGIVVSGSRTVESSGGGSTITKTINSVTTEDGAVDFYLIEGTAGVTYAFTASNGVRNLTVNGAQTISNVAISIYGTFTHQTTGGTTTFTAGANAWTFAATSGNWTINYITGFTYDFPWTFGGATSTAVWTLPGNLTLGATRQLTLANGTTDFNSKTVSAAGITISTGTPTIANTGTADFTTTLPVTHASGTLTLTLNVSVTSTSGYTLTSGTLALGTYTLTTAAFSSTNTNTRSINFGTGKIVLNRAATATIWNTGTATNFSISGTPTVESIGGGAGVTKTITLGTPAQANSIDLNLIETTGTATYSISGAVGSLTINGTQTVSNNAITIYKNYTYSATNGTTTFTAGTNAWTFGGTGLTQNITAGSATYNFPWTFNGTSGNIFVLQSAATIATTRTTTLTNGTLDLNGFTYTTGLFTNAAGTHTLLFDGGSLTLSGSGATVYTLASPGSMTISKGTANGTISLTSASAKTFAGGGINYSGVILNQGGTGLLTVSGSNTFENFSASINATANSTTSFTAGTTTTFNNFTPSGSVSFQPTLNSTTVNSPATFYSAAGISGFVTGADRIIVQDIAFTPFSVNGTDYIRWHIGANSSIRNSTGALAQTYAAESTPKVYVIETGSSWTVPSDFNTANNTVYLIGAGGSGLNGSAGANGGGGGGYTVLSNVNLTNGSSIAYSVGLPDGNGTNSSLKGGDTTFGSLGTAGGGFNNGNAGTGTTANGGAAGSITTSSGGTARAGSGGGGAGGPSGTGAAGGGGFSNLATNARGGGGGGGNGGGTAGSAATTATGGVGGNNSSGVGGGSQATSATGTRGGGGAGATAPSTAAGLGGAGIEILGSLGSGGGGGGGASSASSGGVTGGKYGGGGGGGGTDGTTTGSGALGAQGVIIIQYLPLAETNFPKFMFFFN